MIFTEFRFLAFFGLVLAVYWSLEGNRLRKIWLLAASYAFYAAWDWRFLSLILISTLVDYAVGTRLATTDSESRRRALLLASLVTNLGLLGFFKYFGFFVDSAVDLGSFLGFSLSRPTLEIVLPVGISFYTFQTLSYTIDVYRRGLEATRNLLDLALFVAFFPQLVAGPIVRASYFLPQLHEERRWQNVAARSHLVLFLIGFAKKACISDNISPFVDSYFAAPEGWSAGAAWLAVLLYAIQIYCDFSGYSDMAIATAGLLGYDLGPNFRSPYVALNPRDFWQRWHISLSTWLRDYLYIPLGGNRGSTIFTYRNLMLTMLLGGLWHGAAWHFVVWGFLHGLALCLHRLVRTDGKEQGASPLKRIASTLAMQYWVCLAWIFFRAESWGDAMVTAKAWLFWSSPGSLTLDARWWWFIAAFALAHWVGARYASTDEPFLPGARLPQPLFAAAYGVATAIVLLFVQVDVQPFIYFQF